jgi:hypothetical protein
MIRGPGLFLRPGRTLRVALHPDDLLRPGLREAALSGIDAALDAGVVALTYEDLLRTGSLRIGRNEPVGSSPMPHPRRANLRLVGNTPSVQ